MDTPANPSTEPQAKPPKPLRSVEEALSECQREMQVRERCYPNWVKDGKLTSVDARDRMERIFAACEYLSRTLSLQDATGDTREAF